MLGRREVLAGGVALAAPPPPPPLTLPPWSRGVLEIHHLATGRGDCTLVIAPDGTSLMIDAGATAAALDVSTPPTPSGRLRPGQGIARYARRRLPPGAAGLDYLLATHLHPDHIGEVTPASPASPEGPWRLTGITDVAGELAIGRLYDRAWPDYPTGGGEAALAQNYAAFARARAAQGLSNGRIVAGRADQITLTHAPSRFPDFEVRALACNGEVWSGHGDGRVHAFPPPASLAPEDRPTENMRSVALRIAYGRFRYFAGGDLTAETFDGALPWADIEGAAARACGPVDVAVACHHGYFDAVGPTCVRALQPRIWVVPAWHVTHPDMKPLERMFSRRLYPGARDVLLTQVTPEALKINQRFLSRCASTAGHVVVRVERGGPYTVHIVDALSETGQVLTSLGPFPLRPMT